MNIIKAVFAALGAMARRARALTTGSRAPAGAGARIKAALYDGYVGAYAEFYRNEYSQEASRRC